MSQSQPSMVFPRLLFVSSLPDGKGLIRGDRKYREIERRIALAPYGGVFTVRGVLGARHEEISGLVSSFRPTHLHITCHGHPDHLILEDAQRLPAHLDFPALRSLVEKTKTIRCLVLEACDSMSLAERLQTDKLSTVGLSGKFSPSETDFAFATFYQVLAANRSLAAAYAEMRLDLELLSRHAARAPLIFASRAALRSQFFGDGEDPSSIGVVDDEVAAVALASPLRFRPDGVVLHRFQETLGRLDEAWEQERGIVHLRGAPGSGRTRVLAEWLADLARRGWPGARRVFAWSFRGSPEDHLCGDVRAFLKMFLEFLDEPGIDATSSEWELGRFVGRLLRRERCLLLLDGVELLPGPPEIASIEARLNPGLVALLRNIEENSPGLCIFTTHDDLSFQGLRHRSLELRPLADSDRLTWLWSRGAIVDDDRIRSLAARLSGNTLALAWAAPTAALDAESEVSSPAPGAKPGNPWSTTIEWIATSCTQGERKLLAELALAGGRLIVLKDSSLMARMGTGDSLRALRRLSRRGLIQVTRDNPRKPHDESEAPRTLLTDFTVVAAHPRLVDVLLAGVVERNTIETAIERPLPDLKSVEDLPRLRRRLRAHITLGQGEKAMKLYVDNIAQYDWPRQWSFICRTLGRHADDLQLLGELFSAPWTRLHPALAGASDEDSAYVFHRVGLGLRHIGRVSEAAAPLEISYRISTNSSAGRHLERASTCANDLAEVYAAIGDLEAATEWARRSVGLATEYLQSNPESRRQAHVCLSLTLATEGDILRRHGNTVGAAERFQRAENETGKIADIDGPRARVGQHFLFSRSGYYHWRLLLDQLGAAISSGHEKNASKLIKALNVRLSESRAWVRRPDIARVTPAYELVARARLLTEGLRLTTAERKETIDNAEAYFASALALFHGNHHVWMVPEVLQARAMLRDLAGDAVAADVDRNEASRLASRLGYLESPTLHRKT